MQKQKSLNLKPKIPDLGICGLEPEKTIFIFSNLYNCKFWKKQKFLNLGPKMFYLGIFGQYFLKTIVTTEISTLEFVKNESLTE